jgi:DNA primase
MSLGHVHLTPQLVAAVRQAVDIVTIAEDHTRLTKKGKRSGGLCPLHREKTPSFTVEPEQGLFYCFGCGQGGDAIKLHMLLSGDDFPAAIESLARRFGVPLPTAPARRGGPQERDLEAVLAASAAWFGEQLQRAEEPRRYLEQRGIDGELARRYGVGYAPPGFDNLRRALAPKIPEAALAAAGLLSPSERHPGEHYDRFRNRLMFPIKNASGAHVGFGGRALGDDKAKYLNTPETERFRKSTLLYGLDQAKRAIREQGRAFLVEGYFDVLGAVAAGVEGTVASMGTSLTAEQAQLLARYADDVVVGYDGDRAGEEASTRALGLLLPLGLTVRRTLLPAGADPDSLRLEQGAEALQRLVAGAPDAVEHELARLVPAGVTDPATQARLAQAAAELLQPVKDPILRWAYGRRAAERLGVPLELLAPRLGKAPAPYGAAARREALRPVAPPGKSPGRLMEEAALRLLLAMLPGGDAIGELPAAAELPPPEAFWDAGYRNLFTSVCVLWQEKGGPPSLAELRQHVESETGTAPLEAAGGNGDGAPVGGGAVDLVARFVIEGLDAPGEHPGRPVSTSERLRTSLDKLHRRWRDQRLRQLTREIHEAQRSGDDPRLQSLVEEKRVLSRAVHFGGAALAPLPGMDRR